MAYIKLIGIALCSLLLASCATSDRIHSIPPAPPIPVDPLFPPITPENQDWVDKVRAYTSMQKYVEAGNANLNEGYQMHRGVDKIMALRLKLMEGEQKTPSNMAFVGNGVNELGSTTGKDLRECNNSGCSAQDTTRTTLNYNTQGYYLAWTPLSDATSYFGFGTGSEVFNYALIPTDFGQTPDFNFSVIRPTLFTNAINEINQNSSISSLIFSFQDGLRFENSKFANPFIDGTSTILSQNVDQNVPGGADPYTALGQIAGNFQRFLQRNANNIFITSTGTMLQYYYSNNDPRGQAWNGKSDKTGATAMNTTPNSNSAYSFYFDSGTGVNNNFGVSGGESFISGDIVKWLQKNGNTGNIAMALAINKGSLSGYDYTYKPFAESMLPGALRDYAFAVPMTLSFSTTTGTTGTPTPANIQGESKGQMAAAILSGQINTLGMWLRGNNISAIEKLKSHFTYKQYGASTIADTLSNASGNLYNIQATDLINKIEANPAIQNAIVNYFQAYASEVSTTVADPLGTGTPMDLSDARTDAAIAWTKIKAYYGAYPHLLARFVTNSDIITRDANNNILTMNGNVAAAGNPITAETVKYAYYDVNGYREGEQIVYKQNGQIIPSNIFGNGIVDFSMILQTNTFTGARFSETRASASSILGDSLQRKETASFLSNIQAEMGSVYLDAKETVDLSLNGQIERSKSSAAKIEAALNNFFHNDIEESRENFNLGFANLGFNVSSLYGGKGLNTASAQKKKVMFGTGGSSLRFGEEMTPSTKNYQMKFIEAGNGVSYSGDIQNLKVSMFVLNDISVSALIRGQSIDNLSLETGKGFTLLSRNLGFRDGYSGFLDLFSENVDIQGISSTFHLSDNTLLNFIAAKGASQNPLTKNAFSTIGLIELAHNFNSSYVKLSSGVIMDEKKYLGSYGSGGLEVKGSDTSFIEAEAKLNFLGNYYLKSGLQYGITNVSTEGKKIISDFSTLHSAGLNLGISHTNFFGGILGLNYSQALRITKGTAAFANGKSLNRFTLSPEGKERNMELSYFALLDHYNVKASLVHTRDLNNIKGEKQNLAVLKLNRIWN